MAASRPILVPALDSGLVALLLALLASSPGQAQTLDRGLWGTNGGVYAMARSGNALFIGGGFSTVGPCMGSGAPVDRRTGAPRRPFPLVNGGVNAAVSDGEGGWYIAGRFSTVDGQPRAGLAHVLAGGRVADWAPTVSGTGTVVHTWRFESRSAGVNVIALQGRTLVLAGLFDTVNGRTRHNLAAVDVRTGALLDWDPEVDNEVYAMAVRGRTVYLGGMFTHIGAQVRNFIGAVDLRGGAATAWSPMANDRVQALAVGCNSVWAGGDFGAIGGQPRNTLAELDAATGLATTWDAAIEPHRTYLAHGNYLWPYVTTLAVQGRTLYVGGSFASAHGQPCDIVAAFDTHSGLKTAFAPATRGGAAYALAVRGNTLYVGGALYWFGDQIRVNAAALDARTGKALAWDPRADGIVLAIAPGEDAVYVGGGFTSLHDWQPRNGLAALDVTTGGLLPWKPALDGDEIESMAMIGNTLYLLGVIRGIDGQPRRNLAAVDASTGRGTAWDPTPEMGATTTGGPHLAATPEVVLVSGYFSGMGGQPRYCLAALDPLTGAATAWDPEPDGFVGSMLVRDDTLYVGGQFQRIAATAQRWMAAIDLRTAARLPWQPLPGWDTDYLGPPLIAAMATGERAIYVGGTFTNMGGFPRADLAAVDPTTGDILPWYPQAGGSWSSRISTHVEALAVRGDEVWIGGSFATLQGVPRPNLAVVDARTGLPDAWEPQPDGAVHTLLARGDTVYVGGSFRLFGGVPRSGLAAIIRPPAVAIPKRPAGVFDAAPRVLALGPPYPNPARDAAVIALSLPGDGPVELTVYDLQGRRVATPLHEGVRPAGAYEVRLDASGWPAGVYFCRLTSAGRSTTKRLLVVH